MRSRGLSAESREVILMASHLAASAGAEEIGPEYFLLALLTGPRTPARDYLLQRGMTVDVVESALGDSDGDEVEFDDEDTAALAALGLDLPTVLRTLEERFGPPDHATRRRRPGPRRRAARMGRAGGDVIKAALLESMMQRSATAPEHILLGLLRGASPVCADLFAAYQISYEEARERLAPPRANAS